MAEQTKQTERGNDGEVKLFLPAKSILVGSDFEQSTLLLIGSFLKASEDVPLPVESRLLFESVYT